ncbi:MAG: 3-isopropylmalate dehydrogenase [Candidatus Limiplasma sp.]|nr:3-isopropylmalate dehydrogenase [Candidatus Limiplasma sp.]
MTYRVALVPGDGIGPEIVQSAVAVLEAVGVKFGLTFTFDTVLAGGCAIDRTGEPLPADSLRRCLDSDSVLLGAVGGPQWETLPGHLRPERALLGIRKELNLYANLRPARLMPELAAASPLRADIAARGVDLLIVRELTGGMYFGPRGRGQGDMGENAFDTEIYSRGEIERIGRVAFDTARKRGSKVCSVDKANVLESSRLWRETMHALAAAYPDVAYSDMLVDNAAMQLIQNPAQFDVIVTSNLFGDILSDEASQLTGSIGLLASASLGDGTRGMYEPIHGSAPDIAGQGIANPIATILSAAMMLDLSFGQAEAARTVENAVQAVLRSGARTRDIAAGGAYLPGAEMTARIIAAL